MRKILLFIVFTYSSLFSKEITLQLPWKYQFQFAGYIMAKEYVKSMICKDQSSKIQIPKDRFHTIEDLLVYAPEIFLQNLEQTLKNYKELTKKFTK